VMGPSCSHLSDYQLEFLQDVSCPQLFAVISWGCAATAWLAKVLNGHPEIFCVHAGNHSWHVLGNVACVDGPDYLQIIGHKGRHHLAAGDVHGVSRHHIPELRRTLRNRFNAVVVVREPISRLRSQLALFDRYEKYEVWNLKYLDDLISRAGVILPSDNYGCRLFVHGANMLNAILEEEAVGKVYRAEDVTRRPEILGDLIAEITRGIVLPSATWLRAAIETPGINQHAGRSAGRSLADWQVDVIKRVVDPRAWEMYQELGYPPWDQALASIGGSAVTRGE
jgi:hypothetical protein